MVFCSKPSFLFQREAKACNKNTNNGEKLYAKGFRDIYILICILIIYFIFGEGGVPC